MSFREVIVLRPRSGLPMPRAARAAAVAVGLVAALASCGGPGPSASVGGSAPRSAAPTAPASGGSLGPGSPTATSGAGIPGQLEVGQPVTFFKERLVGMLVRNLGAKVISIATKGTFIGPDGSHTATAHGAVADLRPGEQRVEIMTIEGDPGKNAQLSLEPASVVTEEQMPPAVVAASHISFGPPTVKAGTVPQLVVPVTNMDQVSHSLVLSSPVIRAGQLVGIASGELDGLRPGQTAPASLSVIGSVDAKDTFAPAVDLVQS